MYVWQYGKEKGKEGYNYLAWVWKNTDFAVKCSEKLLDNEGCPAISTGLRPALFSNNIINYVTVTSPCFYACRWSLKNPLQKGRIILNWIQIPTVNNQKVHVLYYHPDTTKIFSNNLSWKIKYTVEIFREKNNLISIWFKIHRQKSTRKASKWPLILPWNPTTSIHQCDLFGSAVQCDTSIKMLFFMSYTSFEEDLATDRHVVYSSTAWML